MGEHTIYDGDGRAAGSVCGARNVPPYIPGIRHALQRARHACVDPAELYRRATRDYERFNTARRRARPELDWPPPAYDEVAPTPD